MAVKWTIATLERNADGGVVVAHWRARDSEKVGELEHVGSNYGTCGFTPDPTAKDYIAFDSLTQDIVVGWVKTAVESEEIETNIAQQIADSKAPAITTGVPW